MQDVSDAFAVAMDDMPYLARLTLDGVDNIDDDAVQDISCADGSGSDDSGVTLGSTVAGSVTIHLDKEKVACAVKGRELFLEFGIETDAGTEWLPMGTYTATELVEDDDVLTLTACDALSSKFDVDYQPLDGFDFDAQDGVDSVAFLKALCARRGVEVDADDLESIPLKVSPEGYKERQIIGFLGALYGSFADIDRRGILRFCWYEKVDRTVGPDSYYDSGMEKASYDFAVGWLKCYAEPLAETLIAGDESAAQGIYFECPWMDQERLEAIWQKIKGFDYRPVTNLKFFGDPRLDSGDIITLVDLNGETHAVPIMAISHEWDGGIITQMSASGQVKTAYNDGPITRETKRLYAQIVKKQNEIELSIRSVDGNKIASLINMSETEILIQASKVKFEGLVTANSNFQILADGSIEATNAVISGKVTTTDITATGGTIGGCSIVDGKLKIPAANITGTLTARQIDATGLVAVEANITGKVVAQSGSIGDWNIGKKTIESGASTLYSGTAMYSDPYYEDGVETTVTLTPTTVYIEKREDIGVTVDYATWSRIINAANS